MTTFVFPDNTVLCNFASVGRLDLLETILRGRGRWTEAVAAEAVASSRLLPDLTNLPSAGWLGEPIEVTDEADVAQIERVRRAVFGGTDDQPTKHLGEAQTCHVLKRWREFAGSWWVSDDGEALRYARYQGITTRETIDLVAEAVAMGDLSSGAGFGLLHAMADTDRVLRLPDSVADLMQ